MAENRSEISKSEDKIGDITPNPNGRVIDLIVPIIFLIVVSIIFMLYTGGLFSGNNVVVAFSNCEAGKSLSISSIVTLIFTSVYYLIRKVITFEQIGESIVEGF